MNMYIYISDYIYTYIYIYTCVCMHVCVYAGCKSERFGRTPIWPGSPALRQCILLHSLGQLVASWIAASMCMFIRPQSWCQVSIKPRPQESWGFFCCVMYSFFLTRARYRSKWWSKGTTIEHKLKLQYHWYGHLIAKCVVISTHHFNYVGMRCSNDDSAKQFALPQCNALRTVGCMCWLNPKDHTMKIWPLFDKRNLRRQ
jgi:hypothetical protein